MKTCIIIIIHILTISGRLMSQNLPAYFVNLPLQNCSNTIISDIDSQLKFCQFNTPLLSDASVKIYFSKLNNEHSAITLFDSVELTQKTFTELGIICDFAIVGSNIFLLGTRKIVVVYRSTEIQVMLNNGYHRLLKINEDIYLAKNFAGNTINENCLFIKLFFNEGKFNLGDCLSSKVFSLENPLAIYGKSINFITANSTNEFFYVDFLNNSINNISMQGITINKYDFSQIGIPSISNFSINNCMKKLQKYEVKNSFNNLDALESALDSIPHITSISASSTNLIALGMHNFFYDENWFSRLLVLKHDSSSITVKDISFKLNKNNIYSKQYVPYYTFGRRLYTTKNCIVLASSVNENNLQDTFTIEDYMAMRDSNPNIKSIVLVNLKE